MSYGINRFSGVRESDTAELKYMQKLLRSTMVENLLFEYKTLNDANIRTIGKIYTDGPRGAEVVETAACPTGGATSADLCTAPTARADLTTSPTGCQAASTDGATGCQAASTDGATGCQADATTHGATGEGPTGCQSAASTDGATGCEAASIDGATGCQAAVTTSPTGCQSDLTIYTPTAPTGCQSDLTTDTPTSPTGCQATTARESPVDPIVSSTYNFLIAAIESKGLTL